MKYFTNKEVWIWILAALLVINIAVTVTILWRQYRLPEPVERFPHPKEMSDKRPPKGFGKWHEKMGFTPEQDEKLKAERDRFLKISGEIFNKLRENQDSLFAEMKRETADTLVLFRLADETGQLHARLRKESVKHILITKSLTTPEQFEKMTEMMKQWMQPGPHMEPGRQRQFRHGRPEHNDSCDKNTR